MAQLTLYIAEAHKLTSAKTDFFIQLYTDKRTSVNTQVPSFSYSTVLRRKDKSNIKIISAKHHVCLLYLRVQEFLRLCKQPSV